MGTADAATTASHIAHGGRGHDGTELAAFKDPQLARGSIESIAKLSRTAPLCGGVRHPQSPSRETASASRGHASRPAQAAPCA